ncbi:MAG: hypothetical protein ABI462_13345 [Ignavibacteria bacterium]
MIKSKVFDVLKCLSKEEMKRFGDYIDSPLFNKRKIISSLFVCYKKFYPAFDDRNLSKEKIYKKLFPGKSYSDEIFRNLNSILLGHAEDFLAYTNYSNDPLTIRHHLLSEINSRNILTIFEKNFEEGKKMLEDLSQRDVSYFKNEYNLFSEKDIYNSFVNKFSKDDVTLSQKSFLIFAILNILEIQNYIIYECRLLGLDNSLFLKNNSIDEIIKKLPEEISGMPQIQIYYNALMLEHTQNEKYYIKLKSLLEQYGDMIEKEKHYNKYIYMIDYIKRTRPANNQKTTSEIFQLRKNIVEKGLMKDNFMTNMFFLNLVKSGLKLNEYDWVLSFINRYNQLLIPKYRESTTDLSLAIYHFEKGELDISLSHISKVGYEDSFYNLEVKNLTTRIYYEMDLFDQLPDYITAYKMYLSKNRSLGKAEHLFHSIFINFVTKLVRIKEQKKYHKVESIIEQINKSDFAYKTWLLEKAEELSV